MTLTGLLPNNEIKTFDIRNFTEKLTPTKEKNRYICPVCGGNNLTIDPQTGEYQCWNQCECRDIREAVSPWEEVRGSRGAERQGSYLGAGELLRGRGVTFPKPIPLPKKQPVPVQQMQH